ncbi:M36 family metallopeptidase [Nocardioides sp. R-C-SC26]|uniref:M36 family metallopeptidase n=1 Tax=Nocardioides sp. R-C-SC26 TaxID=2870414 RepID=UPI001E58FA26|nr:M36 family metallopeptidase [Nocardioides sp. R-C-SC26]
MTRSRLSLVAAATAVALAMPIAQLSDARAADGDAPRSVLADLLGPLVPDRTAVPPMGDLATDLSYDARGTLPIVAPTATQRGAVERLVGATTTWNRAGTPRMIAVDGGFLSAPRKGDPVAIARGWLRSHVAAFGLTLADVAALDVVRDHELPGIGARVVSFAQTFGGVRSELGGMMTVLVDREGRVVSYAGDSVRETGLVGGFDLSATQALTTVLGRLLPDLDIAVRSTGETAGGYEVFNGGLLGALQYVRRVALPTPYGAVAAYAVLAIKDLNEAWAVVIDASTGAPLLRKSLVQFDSDGTVFENYPGAAKGGTRVVKSFGPTDQSPGGWVDPTGLIGLPGITTLGNNANTAIAWTVPLVAADQYNRPVSLTTKFRYGFEDGWAKSNGSPLGYQADANSAATNLFYHHNRIHDEFYEFGFTESGGNFQLLNTGDPTALGLPGDPIFGGAQSGALNLTAAVLPLGRNNANMLTLPDGIPGFTNMYLWEFVDDAFEGDPRDGDYDASIIEHEYAHGLTNRYVGGGGLGSLGTTQSGAMGEGWGDWFAMNDLFRRGLTRTAVTAAYVGDPERGIRNWNYAESPATFGDYGYDMSGPEVHSDGEIWTAVLWKMRTRILKAVGGNQVKASDVAQHLVMDAMPISPPSPSMLDMRDAIVKAAQLRYGSRYLPQVWGAFAEHGYGASARTTGETDTDPRPGFDVPGRRANGTLTLEVVNATTDKPVAGVRVLGGLFEARATPIATTSKKGRAQARFAGGRRYDLTLQAPGFGIQRISVPVRAGATQVERIALRPNLLSTSAGARVVKVTSQQAAFAATNLVDDTEATSWQTAAGARAYNKGPDQSVTIALKQPSTIETVAVSVLKPIGVPRFAAAKNVTVQTSLDGKTWTTVRIARFRYAKPRPTAPDLALKTYELGKPMRARFVRVIPTDTFASGASVTSSAVVAEVQAFGTTAELTPSLPKPDKPVSYGGSVTLGNPLQGSLLGLDPYRPGVTELSWGCDGSPAANGVDAHIAALPKGAGDGQHQATIKAEVPLGEFQLWFYDENCAAIAGGGFVLDGESVVIPPGAVSSGVLLIYGGALDYQITVTEPR